MLVRRSTPLASVLCISIAGGLLVSLEAQATAQGKPAEYRFEVASVKRWVGDEHNGAPSRFDFRGLRAGRLVITAMSLRDLISFAYPDVVVNRYHLVGGSPELLATRFDIEATFDAASLPSQPAAWITHIRPMMRNLLQDRFKMKVRTEPREMPIFALVLGRSDGRLGPGLKPSTLKCPQAGPPKPMPPGEPAPCEMLGGGGRGVKALGVPLQDLADFLVSIGNVGRHVVDETGLKGLYDITVTTDPTDRTDSVVTAVQEQLGLKITPKTGTRDVLVIDQLELPTSN
ncbi:MAG: TIGR03435 family protein [Vicinamibacterales bacterium]